MAKLIIKKLAKEQHFTQQQLAEKSGVTPQLINSYWNNYVQRVSLDHLERIADALGVQPGELIVRDADLMREGMKGYQDFTKPESEEAA